MSDKTIFLNGVSKKMDIKDDFEPVELKPVECTFSEDPNDDLNEDYRFIRTKLRFAMAASEDVLMGALKQMRNDPSARIVEGCSAIIRTMGDCTKQILDLHQQKKKTILLENKNSNDNIDEDNGSSEDKKKSVKCNINEIIEEMNSKSE